MTEQIKFEKMFEPIKIKGIEIKNRMAMAPLRNTFEIDKYVTAQQIAYFAERARNEIGLIVSSPVCGGPVPGIERTTALLNGPGYMPGWADLIETVHAFGSKMVIQVVPGVFGRQAGKGIPTKAPSPIPMRIPPENLPKKCQEFEERRGLPSAWTTLMEGEMPQEATVEEIVIVEDAYARAAKLAEACGADGIELHFAHGYFAYSFLSPRTNIRTDKYGGSFENRIRFLTNSLIKTRRAVSDSFIVGIRISGQERMPGGLELEDTVQIMKIAEGMGLDYVHLTDGCFEAAKWYVPDEDGTMLDAAETLKKTLKIPIITPSLHAPVNAENALREGRTDMVSLGRSILADPAWVKKVKDGQYNKIVKCIRCLTCNRRIRGNLSIRCEVNPRLGMEQYMPENHRINAPHRKVFYYPRV